MNFKYGKKEMEYLKSRDRRLGEVIDSIGRMRWTVEPDLFSAIVQKQRGEPLLLDGRRRRNPRTDRSWLVNSGE